MDDHSSRTMTIDTSWPPKRTLFPFSLFLFLASAPRLQKRRTAARMSATEWHCGFAWHRCHRAPTRSASNGTARVHVYTLPLRLVNSISRSLLQPVPDGNQTLEIALAASLLDISKANSATTIVCKIPPRFFFRFPPFKVIFAGWIGINFKRTVRDCRECSQGRRNFWEEYQVKNSMHKPEWHVIDVDWKDDIAEINGKIIKWRARADN